MSPPNIDFAHVFSLDLASGLPEYTEINDRAIELVNANEFMRPFKSPIGTPIFFDRKLDGSLWLCVDYRGLKIATGFHRLRKFLQEFHPKLQQDSNITHRNVEDN